MRSAETGKTSQTTRRTVARVESAHTATQTWTDQTRYRPLYGMLRP